MAAWELIILRRVEHAYDVKELADQLRMFPDWRFSYHETALRQILSLADVLVLENVFGLSHAAEWSLLLTPGFSLTRTKRPPSAVRVLLNKLSTKRSMQTEICLCLPLKVFQVTCCLQSSHEAET